jgi:hypothetical protein
VFEEHADVGVGEAGVRKDVLVGALVAVGLHSEQGCDRQILREDALGIRVLRGRLHDANALRNPCEQSAEFVVGAPGHRRSQLFG